MILYVNENNEIKDVNVTSDPSLIPLQVDDNEENPFATWSVAKICCYKVEVNDGVVTMMTPYIDSRLLEHIDQLGKESDLNASDASDLRAAVEELYELMLESEV